MEHPPIAGDSTDSKMRKHTKQKKTDKARPASDAVHSPVARSAPAWFYDRKTYEKAEKIADWMDRGLATHKDFTLPRICAMLGVGRQFVLEAVEWFGCERPKDEAVAPKPVQPDTPQTVWAAKPRADVRKPVSKGGPDWVKRR